MNTWSWRRAAMGFARRRPLPYPMPVALGVSDDLELTLLVAATARPAGGAHRGAIAGAATPGAIDWNRLLRLVDRHRVAPLVFDALNDARDTLPAAPLAALRARAVRDRVRALQSVGVLAAVTDALSNAGVEAVSVKGPVLAQLAFGDVTLRQCRDIDVLIPPAALAPALAALAAVDCHPEAGAGPDDPVQRRAVVRLTKDLSLVHRPTGIIVELHWRLNTNSRLMPPAATRSRQTVALGAVDAVTLGPDALLLYLCVHGARHYWFRLKWLADVHALLAVGDADDIAAFHRRSVASGLGVPVGQTLLMLEAVYGLPLPDGVRRPARRSWRTRVLTRAALRYLAMEREPGERWQTAYLMNLGHIGFRSEAGYVGREIAGYLFDRWTVLRLGGTRRGYFTAIVGRPYFWLARRLRALRSTPDRP